jgi:hypothetical protein
VGDRRRVALMPWGRVDDTWYDHPKLDLLTEQHEWPDRLAAAGLDSLAWSWCNRFLTDGHVPRATVRKLGGSLEIADMLVAIGRWEEAPGGFQIHDFLVYNDSREQVLARRQTEAKRKAEWRAKRRPDGSPSGTASVDDEVVPPGVPAGVPPSVPPVSRRVSRDSTRAGRVARIPTRPDPSRPNVDSPNPAKRGGPVNPRANGTNPRALGTSPRQVAAAAKAEADGKAESRRYRVNQRLLAYSRGAITEAQQADMNQRDAPLAEIPDHAEHQAALAAPKSWVDQL